MGKDVTGLHYATLDEKGRLMLPAKLRGALDLKHSIVVKGNDCCLWLFPLQDWLGLRTSYLAGTAEQGLALLFEPSRQRMLRRLNQYEEVSMDASCRITIGSAYRRVAGLERRCVLVGMGNYLELWAEEAFLRQLEAEQRG